MTETESTPSGNEKNKVISKNEKSKNIYFIILYRRKEKENEKDFIFTKYETEPKKIYCKEIEGENGTFLYEKVFKLEKKLKMEDCNKKNAEKGNEGTKKKEVKKEEGKKKGEENKKDNKKKENKNKGEKIQEDEIEIQFQIGDKDNYIIKFNVDEKTFYYDIGLKKGNKFLTIIAKETIDQSFLNYYQKLELFISALKQNKEEGKIDNLYEETIKLYSKKKGFYLLISLFINIYDKQNLCPKLIEEFNKMNKDKKNEKNMDRKEELNAYLSKFSNISSEADKIIKNKGYNPIHFYGIIFCYLNYYDYKNFKKYLQKLYDEKSGVVFEILITYYSNFLNPIDQDLLFFKKFIEYVITNKEFDTFENTLKYILDVETFVVIIEQNMGKIMEKFCGSNFKTITIKPNLIIHKRKEGKEIDDIINKIESIINFSESQNKLLIYFNSNFWINILKHYNEPNAINIDICFRLRELLKKYQKAIENIFKDTKNDDEIKIKTDIEMSLHSF